ncbi:MAG: TolC family protein [Myxococcota bacterium]
MSPLFARPLGRVLLACLLWAAPWVARATDPIDLTLDDALTHARSHAPALRAAAAGVAEARGDLRGARVFLAENPEVEATADPAAPGEGEFAVRQRVEIGWQRGARIQGARAGLGAAEAEALDVEREVAARVAEAFAALLAAQDRLAITEEDEALAVRVRDAASRRAQSGVDAPLEADGARLRAVEASRARIAAGAEVQAAAARLVQLAGYEPGTPVRAREGGAPFPDAATLEAALRHALAARPDLVAAERALDAARAERSLAIAESLPEVTLGAKHDRSGDEPAWQAVAGLTVPLFDQNQGDRARAAATVQRREAELDAVRARVEAEVRSAWARYDAARSALALYDEEVRRAWREGAAALAAAFEAGKLSVAETAVLQRERLESRLAWVEARRELTKAGAEMVSAAALDLPEGGTR